MTTQSASLARLVAASVLCCSLGAIAQTTSGTTTTTGPGAGTGSTSASAASTGTTSQGRDFSGDLAKASLAKQGIAHPTPAQLSAERKIIQDQRAKGMGWGQIAHSMGLNFGKVVSASNKARRDERKEAEKAEHDKDRKFAKAEHDKDRHDGDKHVTHRHTSHKDGGHQLASLGNGDHGSRGGDHGGGSHGGGGGGGHSK